MFQRANEKREKKSRAKKLVPQEQIELELSKVVNLGNFECAYLFSEEGLLLAGVQGRSLFGHNEALEAYYSIHEGFSFLSEKEEFDGGQEILMLARTRKRISIRRFFAFGQQVVLVLVIPRGKTFRAHANRLIRLIRLISREVAG